MKHFILIPLLSFLVMSGYGQKDFPKDTSYTIRSAVAKLKKNYPFVKLVEPKLPKNVLEDRNVVYANLDGRHLHVDVFYPKKRKKKGVPGVLMIHGGGWVAGSKEHEIAMAQQIARKGYVTVAVEYRLSLEAPYPAAIHDLKSAVRWMRANADKYGIDTARIAARGCSAGAHLASFLGMTNGMEKFEGDVGVKGPSSSVQAVLNIDGIVSFIHPEAAQEKVSAGKFLGGSRKEAWDNWVEASPLEYAGEDTVPFLFVNSSYPRFHAGRDDLFKILDKYDTHYEVYTFEDSPHSFWLVDPWFKPTLKYSLKFLKKVF